MALTVVLGLVQVLYEDVLLFLATTRDGVPAPVSSPLVAIGVPLTIAAALILLLVGGALWTEGRPGNAGLDDDPDEPERDG